MYRTFWCENVTIIGVCHVHFCDCCLYVTVKDAPRGAGFQKNQLKGRLKFRETESGEEGGNRELAGTEGIQEKRHLSRRKVKNQRFL